MVAKARDFGVVEVDEVNSLMPEGNFAPLEPIPDEPKTSLVNMRSIMQTAS